ncbi:hypothetical protein Pcinc_003282 [Petrolisthes cinctipes]|uniref:Uncharacterized protein n=1 Tax=Petrolisthes cinctipes TaxID=88211 RepID=A0AAE1L1B4_PETCI|nr:hypothetical protein Pcinc_003282 [Petrolisthes cinctipes]
MKEVTSSLEQQLKESQIKQEATEQESQLLRTQLQEMKNTLENKNDKTCEDSASMDLVERELTEAQEKIQELEEKVIQHVQAINTLQIQLDKKDEEDCVSSNKDSNESQYLQKLETFGREEALPHQQSSLSSEPGSPWDISCKISETLQVLEESVMIPSSPRRSSVGGFLDEPLIQSNDLVVFIKQELIKLQEALAQEQQNRKPHHNVTDMEWRQQYYNQVFNVPIFS